MEKGRLTGLSASELEDFFLLMPRVFSDYRDPIRGKFGIVYAFGETTDNEDSTFRKVVELVRDRATRQIGICKGPIANGYAGFEHSVERLCGWGFDMRSVPIVPIRVEGNVNTRSEAEALDGYCANLSGDIAIVAPAFHLLRAFTTVVSVMEQQGRMRHVYAIAGEPLSWMRFVRHSQGTLQNTRAGLVANELVRMEKYRAPEYGEMFNAKEVLAYLAWRDNNM